ncbi:hypothetical protein, partial [Acinetobacter sp. 251-1]|uniref:hypothetical protein n=1 Tax=Acinetobacter sp. 251-1 TaxID=2746720 RepID=UPI0025788631
LHIRDISLYSRFSRHVPFEGDPTTGYPSYALNLDQLGALCISNLCATKPQKTEGTSIESN